MTKKTHRFHSSLKKKITGFSSTFGQSSAIFNDIDFKTLGLVNALDSIEFLEFEILSTGSLHLANT